MKRVLFLYWHGIGDNILATPAIKKYKHATGNFIGWMMNSRIRGANVFNAYPYVDRLHWCSDAWHCCGYNNLRKGRLVAIAEARKIQEEQHYDDLVIIDHGKTGHKIQCTATQMGVYLNFDELHTEFHYNPASLAHYYCQIKIPDEFAFIHHLTGSPVKNVELDWCRAQLPCPDMPIVSPDSWDQTRIPIAFAADVMTRAKYLILADSGLYHIAHAMELPVYRAVFKRGKSVWDRVHPLHDCVETVTFLDA